jgi:4'-phosphopantetheinyl transferase
MKLYLYDNKAPGAPDELFRSAAEDHCAALGLPGVERPRPDPGGSPGDAFAVVRGPHGKPYFAGPPLRGRVHFSLSHSGAYRAVLFHDEEVGLDIEDLSLRGGLTPERMERIAARFFAGDEQRYLIEGSPGAAGDHPDDLRARFFSLWTAKEAYIKYTGRGMSEGLSSFSALAPPDGVTITTFSAGPGLICSFCTRGKSALEIIDRR